jgi:hypothetical protein
LDQLRFDGIFKQGFGVVAKMVMKNRALSVGAKALYSYICTYAGSGETAWPGRALICGDLQISKDTYTKYLKQLKEQDYIRTEQININGQFGANVFIIVSSPCPKKPDTEKPCPKKPCPKKPDTEKSDTNNNSLLKTTDIKKEQQQGVVASLCEIGVKEGKARALVRQHGADTVTAWIPLAKEKKHPAGYIVKALEEAWALPPAARPRKEYEIKIFKDAQGVEYAERVEVKL